MNRSVVEWPKRTVCRPAPAASAPVPVRKPAFAAGGGSSDLDETIRNWIYSLKWLGRQGIAADAGQRQRRVDGAYATGSLLDSDGRLSCSGRMYVSGTVWAQASEH